MRCEIAILVQDVVMSFPVKLPCERDIPYVDAPEYRIQTLDLWCALKQHEAPTDDARRNYVSSRSIEFNLSKDRR